MGTQWAGVSNTSNVST